MRVLYHLHTQTPIHAVVAQLVEHVLGKDEVTSSILVNGSRKSRSLVSHAHTSFTQRVTSLRLAVLVGGSRKKKESF